MDKYKVVDLFAGAGGLSLGFEQTNKYDIKVAFENNPDMQATYKRNHPKVEVLGDVCKADYSKIRDKYGDIDVVIGGPPCQGFSNANRQKNHAISQNNMLVKQYIRAILELQPKGFVMENVSMLKSDVHRFFLSEEDVKIVNQYSIPTKDTVLQLLDKAYMFDGAMDIIKDEKFIIKNLWDEGEYSELNIIYKACKSKKKASLVLKKHEKRIKQLICKHAILYSNPEIEQREKTAFEALSNYYDKNYKTETLINSIEPIIMTQRMLSKAKEIYDNHLIVEKYDDTDGLVAVVKSFAVYDYLKAILQSEENGYVITSDVICAADYGAPQKRMRFVVMGIKKDISCKIALPRPSFDADEYRTVRDAISDLENVPTVFDTSNDTGTPLKPIKEISDLGKKLRNTNLLFNHIITKTTDTAMDRFAALKQGQNFHSLSNELKINTYTDISRTQNTIYLRLNYDEPSGTVVNVRKSMWIHPTLNRAVSVREAARLQTFPDSFVFCGSKDKQYQQVGNAVPPIMAKSIAKKMAQTLMKESKGKD